MTKELIKEINALANLLANEIPLYTIHPESIFYPHIYGEAIHQLIQFIYKQTHQGFDYIPLLNNYLAAENKKQFTGDLNEDDIKILLLGFVRRDRLDDGFLLSKIQDGTVTALLLRWQSFAG